MPPQAGSLATTGKDYMAQPASLASTLYGLRLKVGNTAALLHRIRSYRL